MRKLNSISQVLNSPSLVLCKKPCHAKNSLNSRTALAPLRALTSKRLQAAVQRALPERAHKHFRHGNPAPHNHDVPKQGGTQGQLSRSCQETGHGLRPYTCFPAPSGYTRSETQWLSFALFPQLTWVSQPIQGPCRGCQGAFCLQPHAGSGLPRRKVSPTFPCAPCSQERSTQSWTD